MTKNTINPQKLFIGRSEELARLNGLAQTKRSSMVVIKGRRRVGKSRLVTEFAKDKVLLSFSGLTPIEGVSSQHQRDAFAYKVSSLFNLERFTFSDWLEGFDILSKNLSNKKTVILFDEISWMGTKDPTFLPKLKVWWDQVSEERSNIILVLCGSVSTWIEENIIKSTAFFGRISLKLTLHPLSLSESFELLRQQGVQASNYDILRVLSITGGIPWYLENIRVNESIDENIKRLCFSPNELLVDEFNMIFHDLFDRKGELYKKIVVTLSEGMRDYTQIRENLGYSEGGSLKPYIDSLIICGYVTSHQSWSFKTGKPLAKNIFRLSDNYLRFYLKVIEPSLSNINRNAFQKIPLNSIPGWSSIMGIQIENLLLSNREKILESLGVHPQDVIADNPFIQRPSKTHEGVQIDYLIQTKTGTLYLCEIKFNRREVGPEVIKSVQRKIDNLQTPKELYVCPVLLHFGGITDSVLDSRYFYRVIDINDFF